MKTIARDASIVAAMAVLLLAAGCAMVGPDYERPTVATPDQYRTAGSGTTAAADTASFADLSWREVFAEPQLQSYIEEALANNWDTKIAAARVLQAAAVARVSRSRLFPGIDLGGDLVTARTSEVGPSPVPAGADPEIEFGSLFASLSPYEIDLWGRIRRANEAARAQLLASEAAQETVWQTLVAQVASAYIRLSELDYELELSLNTLAIRNDSLELTTDRQQGGVASLQDVVQARVLVASAEATIVDVRRLQEQTENELSILLGRNPGTLERGSKLREQTVRTEIPAGLPSSLLERRPDIRAAEQELIAANADIGVAKAAFFPQVTLTGAYGTESVSLSDLFTGPSQVWQFGPTLSFPVFTWGRLTGQYDFAKARFEEVQAGYQQTVQNAFREVSDALIQYQRTREFAARQAQVTRARQEASELADVRYRGGVTSYLEVLFSEQELFTAELQLAQALGSELLSVVQLYRALGGGWQGESAPAPQ